MLIPPAVNARRAARDPSGENVELLLMRHDSAFDDIVGADAAVKGWRWALLEQRAAASSVNQALAVVARLYRLAGLRIRATRVRLQNPRCGSG